MVSTTRSEQWKSHGPLPGLDQYRINFNSEQEHTVKLKYWSTAVITLTCSTKVILRNLFAMRRDDIDKKRVQGE